ncbi:MAG: hypothetical protein ACXWUG_18425 [Polyangiales bacterium]
MALAKNSGWKPKWWNEETHGSAWERVREALRRDWQQTKHDLHMSGGHELNQTVKDTVKQIAGKEEIRGDLPNPPKVIGSFDDVELPIGYGHGAQKQYPNERFSDVEGRLRADWDRNKTGKDWIEVREYVRRGYEYDRQSLV